MFKIGDFSKVKKDLPLDKGRKLTAGKLAGVELAACLLHTGDFDTLTQTYHALGMWIEANGYQIAGPSREVYLRAPNEDGGALTEIQWPVTKA